MNKKVSNKLRKNNGYTGLDLSVSLIVIFISVSIIVNVFYNLYLSGTGIKRNVLATNYAINILETIKSTEYSKVNFEDNDLKDILDELLKTTGSIQNGKYEAMVNNYVVIVEIEEYSDINNIVEIEDYIKIIKLQISYNVNSNEEILEISTLKTIN